MKSIDSEMFSLPIIGQQEVEEAETVEVTLYETQCWREVRAVHHRGGDRLNAYGFRVVNGAWNVCAHRSEAEPPIGVVQAVERFGYHVRDAGSYPAEYADVQHIGDTLDVLTSIHSASTDPLLRGFLSEANLLVAFGLSVLDIRATIVDTDGEDAFDEVIQNTFQRFAEKYDEKMVELGVEEVHRELAEVATDGGRLCPEELSQEIPTTVDGFISAHHVDQRMDGKSMVNLESSEANGNRKLLVTAFDERHVDRYEFDVIDPDKNTCVFQRGDSRERPPVDVVKKVRQAGYEITNIPASTPDGSVWKQLSAADRLLNDITQLYESGSFPYELLDTGQKAVQDALFVAVVREVMEPKQYVRTLAQAVRTSPLVETAEELESVSQVSDLEDFLKEHFLRFISSETKREIREFCEEYDIL